MARIVEFHILQNFAPSNLNRDDTGAPKDAVFGGVRRARISSQCVKRAVRMYFSSARLIDADHLADRTRNIVARLRSEIQGSDSAKTDKAIEQALALIDLKVKKKGKGDDGGDQVAQSEYLLFFGRGEIAALAKVIGGNIEALASGKADKEVKKLVTECIGTTPAVDVALFGRMLADRKDFNVDAAAQVAHALSTHRVDREVDFFTAVDDFVAAGDAVSGMLGTVEFNSSCYYRYALVNLDLLAANLGGDPELEEAALGALLLSLAQATPTGKQNTFAAHNPPAFVGVSLREGMPINLANAFERPVAPSEDEAGLTAASVVRLKDQWEKLASGYGVDVGSLKTFDLTGRWVSPGIKSLADLRQDLLRRFAGTDAGQ